jgi:2-keto-3-deoxy-L-rhamnonate aldolase RhmA
MKEHWINPVAWSPRLVDQLIGKGWKTFQLDLEGGFLPEDTIAWAIDYVHARGAGLIVRVPADDLSLLRKLAKYGVRRFLAPGFASVRELQAYASAAREFSDAVGIVAMIESRALMDEIGSIARIEGVSGIHFGLVDLCKEMGVALWRDLDSLPDAVTEHAGKAAAQGLTVGTYMLPQWRGTHWPRHFDVLSYVLSEFAEPDRT